MKLVMFNKSRTVTDATDANSHNMFKIVCLR